MENFEREYDWNDTIEHDSEFTILPDGEYDFAVENFERGRHPGSEKLPPCNKAILTLRVFDNVGNTTKITHNLFLHSKCEGLLCAFFTSIGQRKHGEQLRMDWNAVIGKRGRCRVYIDTFTNKQGKQLETNRISKFLEPVPQPVWQSGKF